MKNDIIVAEMHDINRASKSLRITFITGIFVLRLEKDFSILYHIAICNSILKVAVETNFKVISGK